MKFVCTFRFSRQPISLLQTPHQKSEAVSRNQLPIFDGLLCFFKIPAKQRFAPPDKSMPSYTALLSCKTLPLRAAFPAGRKGKHASAAKSQKRKPKDPVAVVPCFSRLRIAGCRAAACLGAAGRRLTACAGTVRCGGLIPLSRFLPGILRIAGGRN